MRIMIRFSTDCQLAVVNRGEKAGLRRDAIGSQVIEVLKAKLIRLTIKKQPQPAIRVPFHP